MSHCWKTLRVIKCFCQYYLTRSLHSVALPCIRHRWYFCEQITRILTNEDLTEQAFRYALSPVVWIWHIYAAVCSAIFTCNPPEQYVSTHHIQLCAMIQVGGARSRQQGRVVGRQSLRRRVVIVRQHVEEVHSSGNIGELLKWRD